jgi:hypothetical protein
VREEAFFAVGEGKNARDRDVVVNCISRRRQKDDRETRERESERLRGERMKHFPHKFNAQHAHTNTRASANARERKKNAFREYSAREDV